MPVRYSLSRLQALEATARLGSLKNAGAEIGVSTSAISHRLKDLEREIGVTLYTRTSNGVSLTAQGKELARTLEVAFGSIEQQILNIQSSNSGKMLLVSCTPAFANRFVIPGLPDFFEKHPDISLSVVGTNERADLETGPIDVAIRFSQVPDRSLYAKRISTVEGLVVGSQDIVTECRQTQKICCPRISITYLPDLWKEFRETSRYDFKDSVPSLSFESMEACIQAAADDAGLCIVPRWSIEKELADQRLIVLESFTPENPFSYWLVALKNPIKRQPILQFERWLLDRLSKEPLI